MSKAPAADTGDAAPPKSKKMLFVIIGLVIVLLVVVAGAALLLLKPKPHDGEEEEVVEEKPKAKKKNEHALPPAFIPLETFVVNLSQDDGGQFLQIIMTLRVEDPHEENAIKVLLPQIRNNVLRLLSMQKAAEMQTLEGRDKLQELLKDEINNVIEPPKKGYPPDGPIQAVLFTSFIIQ
ncbi:MAG: hypothetical protein RIR18_1662 [Pseudomonadota bacterium]|jgi:flagellar FliL protein